MATFDKRFRSADAPSMGGDAINSVRPDLASGWTGWYLDPNNQSLDTFLNQMQGDASSLDPSLAAEARRIGISPQMATMLLQRRQALRDGTTRAFLDPNGELSWSQWTDKGGFDKEPAAGSQRIGVGGTNMPNPLEGLFGAIGQGPSQGSDRSTSDMVVDPTTGAMIDRGTYNTRYGPKPDQDRNSFVQRQRQYVADKIGGAASSMGASPMGGGGRGAQKSFGGAMQNGGFRGFGNMSGRRY